MSRAVIVIGPIAIVPLTKGFNAIIDVADLHHVEGWSWSALVSPRRTAVYACRVERRKMILMHRSILGATAGDFVDHKDGNGLNNCRSNIRTCSQSENNRNMPLRSDNASGLKGVIWDERNKKWRSEICADGKRIFLGRFSTAEKAYDAYADAAVKLFGEFVRVS